MSINVGRSDTKMIKKNITGYDWEWELLTKAAKKAGINRGEYVIRAALETIEKKEANDLDLELLTTGKSKETNEITLYRSISALKGEWDIIDSYLNAKNLKRSTFLIINAVLKARKSK